MSRGSDNSAAVILGLVGLGLLGAAVAASTTERKTFQEELAAELGNYGYALVSCALGRNATNAPVWNVTLRHPIQGIMSLAAEFPPGTAAYSTTTRQELAVRIVAYMQAGGR